jgi:Transposase zinc-binding domain
VPASAIHPVSASRYQRRDPESTVLYQIVREHLATFFARIDSDPDRRGLPPHVRREFERFLSCGVISAGFCRVYCPSCRTSLLVAYSCKARAVCPSCSGRRMAEAAAHLVDHVLPEVPIRQWVLSLPHPVRFLVARDAKLCREVRGIFIRAVQSFYCRRARDAGLPQGRCGAVVYTQRFEKDRRECRYTHHDGLGHGDDHVGGAPMVWPSGRCSPWVWPRRGLGRTR